jgi:hypothetical protein
MVRGTEERFALQAPGDRLHARLPEQSSASGAAPAALEELRQIKLGDLVEYLGLVPVRRPLQGRATPPADAEV